MLACTASLLAASVLASGAAGASAHDQVRSPKTAHVHAGGALTVLENVAFVGDWTTGLDPGATTGGNIAVGSLLGAVYGELFEVGVHNKLIPDLATGYKFSNGGKTLTIDLRHGVSFTDGTPFNAQAVVYNIKRDLKVPLNAGILAWPKISSMATPTPYTVVVHFVSPDGAAVTQMLNTAISWIASPTALKKLGEKRFKFYPVGAGPFEVVSDTPSVKLVLKKNPHYWKKGHPYLNGITFESVSSDESALEDLQSHDGQAYEFMQTPQLVSAFKSAGLTTTQDPGDSTIDVQLNDGLPPFNNLKAREALYYATDSAAISKKIFDGSCPLSQSFTGPGGLFYAPKVPGYRTYDLSKAKALVKQLGGLSFTLWYLTNSPQGGQTEAVVLQAMYEAAGMKVKLADATNLTALVDEYDTHKWQAVSAGIGSFDPAGGIGVSFRLASNGPFTGIHDPTVDHYIDLGAQSINPKARAAAYVKLAKYVSQKAYTPFICASSSWDIAAKGVTGPGLTSPIGGFGEGPIPLWEDVSISGK